MDVPLQSAVTLNSYTLPPAVKLVKNTFYKPYSSVFIIKLSGFNTIQVKNNKETSN